MFSFSRGMYTPSCFRILDSVNSSIDLKLKEAFYISKNKPDLNKQLHHFKRAFNHRQDEIKWRSHNSQVNNSSTTKPKTFLESLENLMLNKYLEQEPMTEFESTAKEYRRNLSPLSVTKGHRQGG